MLECLFKLGRYGPVQVDVCRWNGLGEPLVVERNHGTVFHHGFYGVVDRRFKRFVAFGLDDAVGFDGVAFATDHPVAGVVRAGHQACQQDIVHEKRGCAAGADAKKGFREIFGGRDFHAEILLFVGLYQPTQVGAARSADNDLVFEVGKIF